MEVQRGAVQQPTTNVELSFSCKNLVNMDVLSKSDPLIVAYMKRGMSWTELGRTEVIKDNLNPKFVKKIIVDYFFEEIQQMKFEVYDIDDPTANLAKADFIGLAQCNLSDILTTAGQKITLTLTSPTVSGHRGTILIEAEEMQNVNSILKLTISGNHLDKKDFFGKSDPYVIISRAREDGTFTRVCQTEVIKKTLDPRWMAITIPVQRLNNGDFARPLLFECFDWNKTMDHELIGSFSTNLNELLSGKRDYELKHPHKVAKNKKYTNSGTIHIDSIELIKQHSFLEFIAGGCEISLIVAIDFTASNGNPMHSTSLHYNNPYQPNEYVSAIKAVGDILSAYDSDRLFPAFGFGAKLPPTMEVSHCFALNGNPSNPEVAEVQGILQAYSQALNSVTLYGPTIFGQILRMANQYATSHSSQEDQKYFILLIITDGVINDMQETIDWIVQLCNLPLSIVIVGVGSADFTNMEVLDADDNPLRSSRGVQAARDIVQFVPFRKFKDDPVRLAKETLAEIPAQLVSFMAANRIAPNAPGKGIRAAAPAVAVTTTTTTTTASSSSSSTNMMSPMPSPQQPIMMTHQPSQPMMTHQPSQQQFMPSPQMQQPMGPYSPPPQIYPQQQQQQQPIMQPMQQAPPQQPQYAMPQQPQGQYMAPGPQQPQQYMMQQQQPQGLSRAQSYQMAPQQPQQPMHPQQPAPAQSWYGQPPSGY